MKPKKKKNVSHSKDTTKQPFDANKNVSSPDMGTGNTLDEREAGIVVNEKAANLREETADLREEAADLRQEAAALDEKAENDFLTGSPIRRLLADCLAQAIRLAQRHGNKVALIYLDLDHFKHINDSLWHEVGDKLLQSDHSNGQEPQTANCGRRHRNAAIVRLPQITFLCRGTRLLFWSTRGSRGIHQLA